MIAYGCSRGHEVGWRELQRRDQPAVEKDAPVESFVARLLDGDEESAEQMLKQTVAEYRRRRSGGK